jgi:hypothetical protein
MGGSAQKRIWGDKLRRRPTVWNLITFGVLFAVCLVTVPFLVAFERIRNVVQRRKVAVIEPAE